MRIYGDCRSPRPATLCKVGVVAWAGHGLMMIGLGMASDGWRASDGWADTGRADRPAACVAMRMGLTLCACVPHSIPRPKGFSIFPAPREFQFSCVTLHLLYNLKERQMYNVESGLEIPKSRRKHSFPYAQMNVGDSFFVADVAIGAMCNYNKRNGVKLGMKFVAKKEGEGVRIWRVE